MGIAPKVQFAHEIREDEESGLRIFEICDFDEGATFAIVDKATYLEMWEAFVGSQDSGPPPQAVDPAQERFPEMECCFESKES